jgi:hypothetical protein
MPDGELLPGDDYRVITRSVLDRLGLKELGLNTSLDRLLENVRVNCRRQLPQVWPRTPNRETIAVVGGGWSLDETFDELRELAWSGAKLVALNGAARWLVERNLRPSAVVILDAGPHNSRFVFPIQDCKYFLAGQCDPATFEAAAGLETYLWHAISQEDEKTVLNDYYAGNWHGVGWTCCVAFRAVGLFRMLGFQKFHLFGVDSCYRDDGAHHAYEQEENAHEQTAQLSVAGRVFRVSAWQVGQAVQFLDMTREVATRNISLQLAVHGDGLISHLVKTGASRLMED